MPVQTIKLTTKRQATFPVELCQDLDLRPGDRVALERRELDGTTVWILRPASADATSPWFGALKPFAAGKSHVMEDIRRSIGSKAVETEA